MYKIHSCPKEERCFATDLAASSFQTAVAGERMQKNREQNLASLLQMDQQTTDTHTGV